MCEKPAMSFWTERSVVKNLFLAFESQMWRQPSLAGLRSAQHDQYDSDKFSHTLSGIAICADILHNIVKNALTSAD